MRAGQGSTSSWTKQVFALAGGGGGVSPLPVLVQSLIYLGKQGRLPAAPLPLSLLMYPWSGTPSTFFRSAQRQSRAEGCRRGLWSFGCDLGRRQGQATFLEHKTPLPCNCCPPPPPSPICFTII